MIGPDKKRITILTVEGREDQYLTDQSAVIALHTADVTGIERVVICSFLKPTDTSKIRWVETGPILSKETYSYWMLKECYKHFDTEFVMIVQRDGYVVNPESWTDEFLNYDYIGAPWPSGFNAPEVNRVGNGGFSIRSKRLMTFMSHTDFFPDRYMPEDVTISSQHKLWSLIGFMVAPVELAARFSLEWLCPEHVEPEKTFGFHDKHTPFTKVYLEGI